MQELTREEMQEMREFTEILVDLPEEERRKLFYVALGAKMVIAETAG
jgi:hypothetical protein